MAHDAWRPQMIVNIILHGMLCGSVAQEGASVAHICIQARRLRLLCTSWLRVGAQCAEALAYYAQRVPLQTNLAVVNPSAHAPGGRRARRTVYQQLASVHNYETSTCARIVTTRVKKLRPSWLLLLP